MGLCISYDFINTTKVHPLIAGRTDSYEKINLRCKINRDNNKHEQIRRRIDTASQKRLS